MKYILPLLSAIHVACDASGGAGGGGAGTTSASTDSSTVATTGPVTGASTGIVEPLEIEAGFVELPKDGGTARMFYAFRPAEVGEDSAPLLVFFNGGPGAATTGILLPFGTGPRTLTPSGSLGDLPVVNPASFSRFANLLYIDARSTGFSYDTQGASAECPYAVDAPVEEALDFVYAILEVVDRRPALRDNPVVLVGESYGGTRAGVMLYALQHYAVEPTEGRPDLAAAAPWLVAKMQAHVDSAFPASAGSPMAPDEVARQFGTQVLIQPNLFGMDQFEMQQGPLEADPRFAGFVADPPAHDAYDVRLTPEAARLVDARAAAAMRDPVAFERLIGVAPQDVVGLASAARGEARRAVPAGSLDQAALVLSESAMREALGALGEDDAYWLPLVQPCGGLLATPETMVAFGEIFSRTHSFITNARYDAVVYTPALPSIFRELSGATVVVDELAPAGSPRPGVIRVHGEGIDADIRFPAYESGHAVSITRGAELAEDVEAWLRELGVLTPP